MLTRQTFDTLEANPRSRARARRPRGAAPAVQARRARGVARLISRERLSPEQARSLGPLLRRLGAQHPTETFRVRIDCALVPFLSADPTIDAATLARFGVLGCEGGNALAALRVDGDDRARAASPSRRRPRRRTSPAAARRSGDRAVARLERRTSGAVRVLPDSRDVPRGVQGRRALRGRGARAGSRVSARA